jgi:hypothetical protein
MVELVVVVFVVICCFAVPNAVVGCLVLSFDVEL